MNIRLPALSLILLLYAPQVYASDCTKSFDQSCLAEEYSSEQVEADYEQRQHAAEVRCKTIEEEKEEERIAYLEHEVNKQSALDELFANAAPAYREVTGYQGQTFTMARGSTDAQVALDARQLAADMDAGFLRALAEQKRLNVECRKAAPRNE